MDDISERVIRVIADVLWADEDDITADVSFCDGLSTNQSDMDAIAEGLEDEFGIKVPFSDTEGFITVCDAINFVRRAVEG